MSRCRYPGGCELGDTTRSGHRRRIKRGYCETHYGRLKRTGQLGPAGSLHHRPCAHPDGCAKDSRWGSPYCTMHASRLRRHGDLGPAGRVDGPTTECGYPGGCEIDDPPGFHAGYCAVHYQRLATRGNLGAAGYERQPRWGKCAYPGGCETGSTVFTHGYCQHHAARLANAGTLGPPGLVASYDHLMDLPTALYRLFDDAGDLLYVGVSAGPSARIRQHFRDKNWADEVRLAVIDDLPDRRSALVAERNAIREERPLHNVVHAA